MKGVQKMSEKENNSHLELVTSKPEQEQKSTKAKAKPKKLTPAQIEKEVRKLREVKEIEVEINGVNFYFEMDTKPTTTKIAEFVENTKALVYELTTSDEYSNIDEEEYKAFTGVLIITELLRVFSTLSVGKSIEERIELVSTLSDFGILEVIYKEIPEELSIKAVESAEKEIGAITEDINKEIVKIKAQLDDVVSEDTETNEDKK